MTYIRLRDGKRPSRHTESRRARPAHASISTATAYEVGIGPDAGLALSGIEISGAAWASAGQPIQARLKIWNKGIARSATTLLKWESPTPGVKFQTPDSRVSSLAPGESVTIPVTFTIDHPAHLRRAHRSRGGRSATLDRHTRIPRRSRVRRLPDRRRAHRSTLRPAPRGRQSRRPRRPGRKLRGAPARRRRASRRGTLHQRRLCGQHRAHHESGTRISVPTDRPACEPGHRMKMLRADRRSTISRWRSRSGIGIPKAPATSADTLS